MKKIRMQASKNALLCFWNLIFIILYFLWLVFNWNSEEHIVSYNKYVFIWVCLLIVIQIVSFIIKRVSIYDFVLWFVIVSYPFMFGLIFKNFFSLETRLLWNPMQSYNNEILFHTFLFVIMMLELFSFSYLLHYNPNIMVKKVSFRNIPRQRKMYQIGIIFAIVGGIAKIVNDINIISITKAANTYSAYGEAVGVGILDDLSCLFLPGIFFCFFSGCMKERTKKILFVLVLCYLFIVMLMTGSRKIQIFSILSLFLGYNASIEEKRLSLGKYICIAIFGLVTLNVLIMIRDYRFNLDMLGEKILSNLFSFNLLENVLGEVFAETGITALSVASIIEVVPQVAPYQCGLTFIRTLPSIFPIGWMVGDFFNMASSTFVINTYKKLPVGSSFIGELYWNWGYLGGAIAVVISGIFISKVMKIQSNKNIRKGLALYFSLFSQWIILVRGEFFDIYRPTIYILIALFALENISKKGEKQ